MCYPDDPCFGDNRTFHTSLLFCFGITQYHGKNPVVCTILHKKIMIIMVFLYAYGMDRQRREILV